MNDFSTSPVRLSLSDAVEYDIMSLPMKKEILLAVLIGLVFGLIITYGIYRATISLSSPTRPSTTTATPSPVDEALINPNLTVISPQDESVVSDRTITVAGNTLAGSYVVIFINDTENITTPDSEGNFSIQAELESGSNIITVHAIDEDGTVSKQEITVVVVTPSPVPAATESAEVSE